MKLLETLRARAEQLPAIGREAVGFAGCGLVAYGAWLVYPPAGFVVAGALLIAGAILWPRAS